MIGKQLEVVEEEKDVEVVVHNSMKPTKQCHLAARTAMEVLNQISKCFHFRDRHIFIKLYKPYVKPHIEFASPSGSLLLKSDIQAL